MKQKFGSVSNKRKCGRVWLIALVLKTSDHNWSVGSNPTASANGMVAANIIVSTIREYSIVGNAPGRVGWESSVRIRLNTPIPTISYRRSSMSAGWIVFWIVVAVLVMWFLIRIGFFRVIGDIIEAICDAL